MTCKRTTGAPFNLPLGLIPEWILLACLFLVGCDEKVPYEDSIMEFRARDSQHSSPENSLLFVGSSSIRMWDTLDQAFPEYPVINRGFGGSQFSDAIHWFDDLFLPHDPQVIFIYEGDNDIASGKDKTTILRDVEQLLSMIRRSFPEVPVVLISPKPSPARWELRDQYRMVNSALEQLANGRELLFFADVWSHSLGFDGKPLEKSFLKDRIHMNELGYVIWRNTLHDLLQELESGEYLK